MILRPFFIAMRMIKRCPTDIFVGLSNICYTPINKFPQNSLW